MQRERIINTLNLRWTIGLTPLDSHTHTHTYTPRSRWFIRTTLALSVLLSQLGDPPPPPHTHTHTHTHTPTAVARPPLRLDEGWLNSSHWWVAMAGTEEKEKKSWKGPGRGCRWGCLSVCLSACLSPGVKPLNTEAGLWRSNERHSLLEGRGFTPWKQLSFLPSCDWLKMRGEIWLAKNKFANRATRQRGGGSWKPTNHNTYI